MEKNLCKSCYKEYTCVMNETDMLTKACGSYLQAKRIKETNEDIELSKTMRHMQVCEELNSLYEAKNHDYGDSFAKVRNELGNVAILVRLYDKVERLKTLLTGADVKVKGENIEDTLKDLANYCLMELVEIKIEGEK